MKILVILQNAYLNIPMYREITYDVWYRMFCRCKSGKRLSNVFGSYEKMKLAKFCNTTPHWGLGSKSKLTPDKEHILKEIENAKPDIVLACGRQAEESIKECWSGNLIVMPHPAARTLTNALIDAVGKKLFEENLGACRIAFRQRRGYFELESL